MEIRFAEVRDVPGILGLLRQVGQVHHEGRPDIFRANAQKYGPSQVLAMLEKSDTPIFVACEGEALLGHCFCQIKTHFQDPVICNFTTLYIDDICVDGSCRGQGVGKALYREACRYAKMRGCYNVNLSVWSCNEGALRFYEALGMQPQKVYMEALLEDTDA